jgi:hypothetical protein
VRAPPKQKLPGVDGARAGANAPRADEMTPAARLAEIAEILAAGLSRLKARQSSGIPADFGESSLDCPGQQSGHANVLTDGGRK